VNKARRPTEADIGPLLEATLRYMVHADATLLDASSQTITRGVSGAEVRRHSVGVRVPDGPDTVISLITKMSDRIERSTLAHLNAQGQPAVPLSHARAVDLDGPDWICLQDLGDDGRPDVLSPLPEETLVSEVAGLASIHAVNAAGVEELTWLPRADREYARSMIDDVFWRPHWESVVTQNDFHEEFGTWLPRVEAAAAKVVDEVAALDADPGDRTLVHTDINPGNVLVHDRKAFFIDWNDAHRGSFYLDLPHHLCTLELAERYREVVERFGVAINPSDFEERYRIAARYTALRYMWWTFEAWRDDRDVAGEWILHYFGMLDL
jgi:aminoglycoside phosphotransferase (APT) family kinase protein